jgi:DNA-nicking Smr family endonuclease
MKRFRYQPPPPRTVPGTTGDILSYLEAHGTRNKDSAASVPAPARPKIEKGKGGVLRRTLDLHGLTSDEASRRIRQTIDSCKEHGVRELLIIHGRGSHSTFNEGPVLKNLVLELLDNELRLSVQSFRPGLPREGGEGVTVAFLN